MPAFFTQDCSTCGRNLRISTTAASRRVICQHCHGTFVASDSEQPSSDWRTALMKRADELLALVATQQALAGAS